MQHYHSSWLACWQAYGWWYCLWCREPPIHWRQELYGFVVRSYTFLFSVFMYLLRSCLAILKASLLARTHDQWLWGTAASLQLLDTERFLHQSVLQQFHRFCFSKFRTFITLANGFVLPFLCIWRFTIKVILLKQSCRQAWLMIALYGCMFHSERH